MGKKKISVEMLEKGVITSVCGYVDYRLLKAGVPKDKLMDEEAIQRIADTFSLGFDIGKKRVPLEVKLALEVQAKMLHAAKPDKEIEGLMAKNSKEKVNNIDMMWIALIGLYEFLKEKNIVNKSNKDNILHMLTEAMTLIFKYAEGTLSEELRESLEDDATMIVERNSK